MLTTSPSGWIAVPPNEVRLSAAASHPACPAKGMHVAIATFPVRQRPGNLRPLQLHPKTMHPDEQDGQSLHDLSFGSIASL